LLPIAEDSDVVMTSNEPELTPISKSKRAQARFANALADITTPCFSPAVPQCHAQSSSTTFAAPSDLVFSESLQKNITATPTRIWLPPVRIEDAALACQDLTSLLHPKRIRKGSNGIRGRAAKAFICDNLSRHRFMAMEMLLRTYSNARAPERLPWMAASLKVSRLVGQAAGFAESLRRWCRDYVQHRVLPENRYGKWTASMLDDGDLAGQIFEHLTSIGQYVQARDVVKYLNDPAVRYKFGLKKGISLRTATRWMSTMGYRWGKTSKGTV
jgi:hypothetical protein